MDSFLKGPAFRVEGLLSCPGCLYDRPLPGPGPSPEKSLARGTGARRPVHGKPFRVVNRVTCSGVGIDPSSFGSAIGSPMMVRTGTSPAQ